MYFKNGLEFYIFLQMHVKHIGAPLEKSFCWTPPVLWLLLFQHVEAFSHIYLVYYLSNNRNSDIFKRMQLWFHPL